MQDKNLHLNILIIEDNPGDLMLLEETILSTGLSIDKVHHAYHLSTAAEILTAEFINLIFLDLTLPDSTGIDSFLKIYKEAEKVPVIVLTGLTDMNVATEAIAQGAQDYLIKGEFDEKLLFKTILYSIERKRNSETMRESNERYKYLFNNNPMPMWVYDKETFAFLEVNEAAIRHYGYSRNEFLGMTILDIRPVSDAELLVTNTTLPGNDYPANKGVWKHIKKDGNIIFVEITTHEISFNDRIAALVLAHDVSEGIRLEKELKAQQQLKQRQITEAVIHAQERERTELGKELHDNVNQILGATKLYINTAISEDNNRKDLLTRSSKLVNNAINEIRRISKSLITPGLKDIGLINAIEDLIEDVQISKKIKVDFNINNFKEDFLDEKRRLTIFRIVQEQLSNILKHANATRVLIRLVGSQHDVTLTVTDNGDGFDTSKHRKGVGITNIISRVEVFNGEVDIESNPFNGCKLRVILPRHKEPVSVG
jgi:two-component system sensor histidine kinase UhpB